MFTNVAPAGADVIGVNCNFGPKLSLKTIALMKEGLQEQNMEAHLMVQPLVALTPEIESGVGYLQLPGHFFGKQTHEKSDPSSILSDD